MKKEFIEYCDLIGKKNLSWGASGNISLRVDSDSFLMSATGTHFSKMNESGVSICSFSQKESYQGRKPSIEVALHREIFLKRDDVNVIVHVHPFFSVLMISAKNIDIDMNIIPEVEHYLGNVKYVKYLKAGSNELAFETAAQSFDTSLIVLRNHGIIGLAENFDKALAAVEAFEFICKLNYYANVGSMKLEKLI